VFLLHFSVEILVPVECGST